jgi:hypothetical protein
MNREGVVRLRPCGRLDYRPAPRPERSKPWFSMTYEEQRQDLIDGLLWDKPQLTPERAAQLVDAEFI